LVCQNSVARDSTQKDPSLSVTPQRGGRPSSYRKKTPYFYWNWTQLIR